MYICKLYLRLISNEFGLFLLEYFMQSKYQTVLTPVSSLNEATSTSEWS